MSKQFNVRISYAELLKRKIKHETGFSEPSLRKFIQNNTVPFKKIPFIESLLEFSAVDIQNANIPDNEKDVIVLANVLNSICGMGIFKTGELKNTILEVNKIRLAALEREDDESLEPETLGDLVDCLNYLFFYMDSRIKEIMVIESVAQELIDLKGKLSSIKFGGELQFIQKILDVYEIESVDFYENSSDDSEEIFYPIYIKSIKNIVSNYSTFQVKLLMRFCFAYHSDSPFYNPFTDLPKSLAIIEDKSKVIKDKSKKDDKKIDVEAKSRVTDKIFFHKQSLDRYLANPNDPYGQIVDSKLIEELSQPNNKWVYCFNFNVKSKLTKLDKLLMVDPKEFEMKSDFNGNIVWCPPFEDFIKKPNILTKPLGEIISYKSVNVLLFLPESFLYSKILSPLRDYLVENFNIKLVVYVYSEKPPIDTCVVLIGMKNTNDEPFCPSYLKTSEWSTLASAVDLVGFKKQKIGTKIKLVKEAGETAKNYPGCWVVEK